MQELSSQFIKKIFHVLVSQSGAPSNVLRRLVVRHFGLSPGAASVAGYLLATVVVYLGQKTLTFRFPYWRRISTPKYLALGALGNIASHFFSNKSVQIGLLDRTALGTVAVLVVSGNFLILKYWSFYAHA